VQHIKQHHITGAPRKYILTSYRLIREKDTSNYVRIMTGNNLTSSFVSKSGSANNVSISKWRQRLHDAENNGPKIWVDNPGDTDVLLGKQRDAFNHIGNRSFRALINANWERYNNAKGRCERTAIVVSIVKFLREDRHVRFLKKDTRTKRWFIVHDSVAREKVGHAIRDAINFRRHHERKMALATSSGHTTATTRGLIINNYYHMDAERRKHLLPQHNPNIPMVCSSESFLSSSMKPIPSLILQNKQNTNATLFCSPSASPISSKVTTFPSITAKQHTQDVAEILGTLKQSGDSCSSNRLPVQRPLSISAPIDALPRTTQNHGTTTVLSPPKGKAANMMHRKNSGNASPKGIDEAAMMGAFNVWASQNFAKC